MKISRFAWYWLFTAIVVTVSFAGLKLAENLGSVFLGVFLFLAGLLSVALMAWIYRYG